MRCTRCHALGVLPSHHWAAAVRRHIHQQATGSFCDIPLHMEVELTERPEGGYDYRIHCLRMRARQEGSVTPAEVQQILDRLMQEE